MKVIEDICDFLNCQPGDILEMKKEIDKTFLLYLVKRGKKNLFKGWIISSDTSKTCL